METCNSFANLGLACHRFKWERVFVWTNSIRFPFGSPGAGFYQRQLPTWELRSRPKSTKKIWQTVAFSEAIFCWAIHFRLHFGRKKLGLNPLKMLRVKFYLPDFYWSEIFEAYLNFLLEDIRIFTDILRFYRQFLSSVEKRPASNWLKWELRPRAVQNAAMFLSPNFLVHKISTKSFQSMIQRLCGKKPSAWETTVESFLNHWVLSILPNVHRRFVVSFSAFVKSSRKSPSGVKTPLALPQNNDTSWHFTA